MHAFGKHAALDTATIKSALTMLRKLQALNGKAIRWKPIRMRFDPRTLKSKVTTAYSQVPLSVRQRDLTKRFGFGLHGAINSELPAQERLQLWRSMKEQAERHGATVSRLGPKRYQRGGGVVDLRQQILGASGPAVTVSHANPDTMRHELEHIRQGPRRETYWARHAPPGINLGAKPGSQARQMKAFLRPLRGYDPQQIRTYLRQAFLTKADGTRAPQAQREIGRVLRRAFLHPNDMMAIRHELDANAAAYLDAVKRHGRAYADRHHSPAGMFTYLLRTEPQHLERLLSAGGRRRK